MSQFSLLMRDLFFRRRSAKHGSHKKGGNMRLILEALEDRAVPAFLAPAAYPTGANPAGIAVGDFNHDGRDDLAITSQTSTGTVGVMLGSADGTFTPRIDYSVGSYPVDATTGDLNSDGHLDLVVVRNSGVSASSVDVLLGSGDGSFAAPMTYSSATNAHSVKVGDFNNDGLLDVGVMNYDSASVLLGNGDGTLQTHLDASVFGNNINLVVGDFDRDGNLDMATSVTNSVGTVNVLRGRGDGSFNSAQSYYAFTAPVYLATGDFNHDGYLDFACPNSYAATSMSVLLNNGDGTYAAPHTYGIAQTGVEIEVADFNNDGNDDFAVRGNSQYMVSLGKGDGSFYPSVSYQTPSGRWESGAHGDFNGDGAVDLVYPTASGITVVANDNADAQNLAGTVTFRVSAPATTTSKSVLPMTVTAIDANGEVATGFRGVVFISSSDPAATTAAGYAFNPNDAGIPYVFTAGDAGSHTFTGAIRLVTAGDQTVTVSAPNLTPGSTIVTVTGQVTRLSFTAPASTTAGDTFSVSVSALDTTGAVATGYSSQVHFASTDGLAGLPTDYTFTPEDAGSHVFAVTLKTAGPKFISATEVGGSITGGTTVTVAAAATTSFTLTGGAGAIGVARPVTVIARDAYGNQTPAYNGTVHFTSSDAQAVLPADLPLSAGIALDNVTLLTVGRQSITATDLADAALTGTVLSDATPPVAALFDVSGYPATTAGDANSFTVTVRDTIGQVATGYAGTVYFSSSDVQAGLPASYTFTATDAGTHTFAATLRTAGLQSIAVRDVTGTLSGSQAGIAVSAAAFSDYRLSVPNGADSKGHILVTAGETISLTVRASDAFGNSVTGYSGTIHLTSTDTLAALPADYTFTATDSGSHTFAVDLRTATPNGVVWSFTVTDTTNPAVTAAKTNFEVINAQAATFDLTAPTQAIAGEAFTSKVTARDAFGNVVKNYFGTVHFSSTSTLAGLPTDYTFDGIDGGVHDFTVSLNSSGGQTLSVADASDLLVKGAETLTVNAAAISSFIVSFPAATTAGVAQTLTIAAVDAYGNVITDYRGTVAFASSDTQAGLPASYAFSNKDAGVHTIEVSLKTAGLQSISVKDTRIAELTGSASGIAVGASAAAGSFLVAGFPATSAGAAQSFTVVVKDAYGNLASGYTGTVNFSSSDAKANLPTSYTYTAADGGSHIFVATLKTAGAQSISVADAGSSTAVGSQTGIAVSALATVSSFTVTGATSTTAGAATTFAVTARDVYGNIVTGYRGTVTFASSDRQAGLPVSYTFSAADAGIHSFSAILKTAGPQSITVKDAAAAIVSGLTGITVNAASAYRFSISAPSTATQGVGFKITVTVLDAYGNVVTGYRGKVRLNSTDTKGTKTDYTFSSKDNGVATLSYTFSTLGLQTLQVVDSANGSVFGSFLVNVVKK
ncbi:MAG: VCBS repeat-containing protein [Gemmataceae bacterium]